MEGIEKYIYYVQVSSPVYKCININYVKKSINPLLHYGKLPAPPINLT